MTRNQDNSKWWAKAAVAIAAATSTGVVCGLLFGAAGASLSPVARTGATAATVFGSLLLAVAEAGSARRLLPQRNKETSQALVHDGPLPWAAKHGALLGMGFASRIGTWLWYFIPLAAFASHSPAAGALIYGVYSFVRLLGSAIGAAVAIHRPAIDVSACVLPYRKPAVVSCDLLFVVAGSLFLTTVV